jgi:hypothetical protein
MEEQKFQIDFRPDDFRELYPQLYNRKFVLKSNLYFNAALLLSGILLAIATAILSYDNLYYVLALLLIILPADQIRMTLSKQKVDNIQRKQIEDIIVTNSAIKNHVLVFGNDGFKLDQDGEIGIYFKYSEIASIHASSSYLIVEKKTNSMAVPVKSFRGDDFKKVKEILNQKIPLTERAEQ